MSNLRRAYLTGHDEEEVTYDSGGPFAIMPFEDLEALVHSALAVMPKLCKNYPTEATMPSMEESPEWGCDCDHCVLGRAFEKLYGIAPLAAAREKPPEPEPIPREEWEANMKAMGYTCYRTPWGDIWLKPMLEDHELPPLWKKREPISVRGRP